MLEAGAGTGGLTKDALPLFEADVHHELLRYCATDITNAFSSGLIEAVRSPKLIFKVGIFLLASCSRIPPGAVCEDALRFTAVGWGRAVALCLPARNVYSWVRRSAPPPVLQLAHECCSRACCLRC